MIKISASHLQQLERDLWFYDFKSHASKTRRILLSLSVEDTVRYADIDYGGDELAFYAQASLLQDLILQTIEHFREEVVIKKYASRWIENLDGADVELVAGIKEVGKRINFDGGILLSDRKLISKFILESLKYNSFTSIILPKAKIVIFPTDHMDIFFAAENVQECLMTLHAINRNMASNRFKIDLVE